QRQAVLDVMQEELDAIEERRQAEQASHQDALKLYEEQQKAIDNVINNVISARSNLSGDIGGLQNRINNGGNALSTGQNIALIQSQLDANSGSDLQSLEVRLELQQELADLELQRLEDTISASEAGAQSAEKLRDAGTSLLNTLDALKLDRSTSLFTNKEIFDESKNQFDDLFAAAQGGDAEAASRLGAAARNLLKENQAFNASGDDAVNLQDEVFSKLSSLGVSLENTSDPVAIASNSLEVQKETAEKLGFIDEGMQATKDALELLKEKQPPSPTELDAIAALEETTRENTLETLQGIDTSLGALGNDLTMNLGEDLVMLGESLGLPLTDIQAEIQRLGADILGPKLDAVINATQGTSQAEQEFATFASGFASWAQPIIGEQATVGYLANEARGRGLDSAGIARGFDTSETNVLSILEQNGIPAFGDGAFVNKPTLAIIGEAGPEFVVPAGGHSIKRESMPAANKSYDEMLTELRNQGRQNTQIIELLSSINSNEIIIATNIQEALKASRQNSRPARTV
ncbi:MAG: hypothetical protein AAF512_02025, partial [Pseudomonadota bacterium]